MCDCSNNSSSLSALLGGMAVARTASPQADPCAPAVCMSCLAFSKPFLLMEAREVLAHPARAEGEMPHPGQHSEKQLEMELPSRMQTGTSLALLWSRGTACVLLWALDAMEACGKDTFYCAALGVAQPTNTCAGAHPVGSI